MVSEAIIEEVSPATKPDYGQGYPHGRGRKEFKLLG